jgi:hypothetical protein
MRHGVIYGGNRPHRYLSTIIGATIPVLKPVRLLTGPAPYSTYPTAHPIVETTYDINEHNVIYVSI